jgi:hypothetical protein
VVRLGIALALLTINCLVVAANAAVDIAARGQSPESVVHRYFAALEQDEVEGALAEIDPESRARWSDFVANGAGNSYRLEGTAIRRASLVDRVMGRSTPSEATSFVHITQAVDGAEWSAGPRVPLVRRDGRWFMGRPPLAPEPR